MLNSINVRFFTYAYMPEDSEAATDIVEITEGCFKELTASLGASVSYEHHTVFDNGCRQVCLTVELPEWPEVEEVELFTA